MSSSFFIGLRQGQSERLDPQFVITAGQSKVIGGALYPDYVDLRNCVDFGLAILELHEQGCISTEKYVDLFLSSIDGLQEQDEQAHAAAPAA